MLQILNLNYNNASNLRVHVFITSNKANLCYILITDDIARFLSARSYCQTFKHPSPTHPIREVSKILGIDNEYRHDVEEPLVHVHPVDPVDNIKQAG